MIDYVYIETTNYCNLKCSYCNREEVIGKLKHMTVGDFISVLEQIKDEPIKEAKLMGMGEPFLHPKFDQICKTYKSYFPNSFLISATNCQYKITESFTEAIQYIDLLYLSIDGYKKNYEQDRYPSQWNKLIDFLDKLSEVKHNCKLAVNYVVNPKNVFDIQFVYDEIVKKYNLHDFRLNIAQEWSPDKTIPNGYTNEQLDYLKHNWQHNIKGKSNWNYDQCFWPERGLYVTVDGNVLMCCMNTAAKPFGNIFHTNIYDIRKNKSFISVKKGCSDNTPTEHCRTCSYKELSPILTSLGVNNG